ncbi:hypothetical protein LF1_20140 [Rubripirellula obstinata]|uniref:Uncharacterized protein n=1 Tax=Rubripirellula obstinata TaxID=406547 RepID=A0A5B1CIQ0_9BACT|nr:hypothetical protein LF1_20140 [Rubripirellula obstinata]
MPTRLNNLETLHGVGHRPARGGTSATRGAMPTRLNELVRVFRDQGSTRPTKWPSAVSFERRRISNRTLFSSDSSYQKTLRHIMI